MKKSEKTVLQGMLQDILHAHESGGFQEAWSRAQESLSQMEEDPDGRRVFDIEWSSEDDDLPSEVYVPEDIALMDLKRYLEKGYDEEVCSFRVQTDPGGSFIQTPSGPMEIRPYWDSGYVGAFLLYTGTGSGEPGVLMEYVPDEDRILLRVWSKEYPEDDPRYVLPMT